MQTFLPISDFTTCARMLDSKRLGKQRVEAWQIVQAITVPTYGWQHHPAVQMWRGHGETLCEYGIAMCTEWRHRGYHDTMMQRFEAMICVFRQKGETDAPDWMNDERVHQSHRASLLAKNPVWYSQWNWREVPAICYFWPTHS